MLIYIKCPSCSELLSCDYENMLKERKDLANNPKLSSTEKDKLDAKIIKKYGITNICCVMRVKTQLPTHEIIPGDNSHI